MCGAAATPNRTCELPMLLHLIRHGQTDWNAIRKIQGQTESNLDDTGREQAAALGKELTDTTFVHVHVSSSQRTRETAAGIFANHDVPMQFHDDLREMRLGRWETLMWPDVERDEAEMVGHYVQFDNDMFDVDGAERLLEMQQRGVAAVERVIKTENERGTPTGANVAIVSHGFLLRAIFAHYLGLPLAAFARSQGLPNCAHSTLEIQGEDRILHTIAGESPATGMWRDIVTASRG